MRILAFDTATSATTTALCDDRAGVMRELRDDPPPGARPGHARQLTAQIVEILRATGTRWEELDRIAVGVGPGTFTGLRIGIATARALGAARGIPLAGICTLDALAAGAADAASGDPVLAAIDARRGEAFIAAYEPSGERVIEPRTASPGELAAVLAELRAPPLAVGSGAVEFAAILEQAGAAVPAAESELHRVSSIDHCRLARAAPASGYSEIRPLYLRLADAEIARRKRQADQ